MIIGNGTVGSALAKAMGEEALGKSDERVSDDVVIICVPTETIDGKQDLSQVKQALNRIENTKLAIIRSTVLPGTTEDLQRFYKFPIMFVPEFGFEDTMYDDLKNPKYYLFGTTDESFNFRGLAKNILPKAEEYILMPSKCAEIAKYITNIWGCFQVVLANTIYDWAGNDVDYGYALRGALKHKNIPQWGWRIHDKGHRGYSGKCLPKDIKAAISATDNDVWKVIDNYNESLIEKYDSVQ